MHLRAKTKKVGKKKPPKKIMENKTGGLIGKVGLLSSIDPPKAPQEKGKCLRFQGPLAILIPVLIRRSTASDAS